MKFVTVVAALSNFAIPFERRPRSSLCLHQTQDAMNLHIDYRAFRRSPLPLLRHASQRLQVLQRCLCRCIVSFWLFWGWRCTAVRRNGNTTSSLFPVRTLHFDVTSAAAWNPALAWRRPLLLARDLNSSSTSFAETCDREASHPTMTSTTTWESHVTTLLWVCLWSRFAFRMIYASKNIETIY